MVPNTRGSIESTLSENGAKIQQAARDTVPRTVSALLKVKNYVNARPISSNARSERQQI